MRSTHSFSRSSLFVTIPAIVASFVLCIVMALQREGLLMALFAILFFFSLISRLWAKRATKHIEASLSFSSHATFPDKDIEAKLKIKNNKLLPLLWIKITMPLSKRLSIVPEKTRIPESSEISLLSSRLESTALIGEEKLGRIMWYEEAEFTFKLKAKERGITHLSSWYLSSGDGFGLSEANIPMNGPGSLVVYPRLVDVNIDPFIKNHWNSSTGPRGIMSDITVIRSTRDYLPFDKVKNINWKQVALGLPLQTNVYEEILPKSISIIFDGESFSGPVGMKEELEECISIIASILVSLDERNLLPYLSLPDSFYAKAETIKGLDGLNSQLSALASYEPLKDVLNRNGTEMIRQESSFRDEEIIISSQDSMKIFYFAAFSSDILRLPFIKEIPEEKITVVSAKEGKERIPYKAITLSSLRRKK